MSAPSPAQTSEASVSEAVDAALPAIMMDARRAAAAVVMGEHGKRRAGTGDAFWQHREWNNGESVRQIDWRRSARSDKLFVREREWQTPALLQVWCDQRATMDWRSQAALPTKAQRALVLGLALSMATRAGGERVSALGQGAPLTDELLFARVLSVGGTSAPTGSTAGQVVLISDGLEAPDVWQQRARDIRSTRAELIVVLVRDPAEAEFPYEGRVAFQSTQGQSPIVIGRAQNAQQDYIAAYREHMDSVSRMILATGSQVFSHATNSPIVPILLTLAGALDGGSNKGRTF